MLSSEALIMNLLVLSLALGTAFGDERLDEKPWNLGTYLGFVESISIDKTVTVPGLLGTKNDPHLYIEAKIPDEERPWFFKVSTASSVISVSDEFVKSNNLKVEIKNQNLIPFPSDYGVGGQLKTVLIPEITIGTMTLNNVQAFVSSSKGKFGTHKSEMQIGLGALDVAYTISPSTGTITFAPSSQGEALVKETGTPVAYENAGWAQVRYGKKKKISSASHLLIPTKISGVDVLTAIEAGTGGTSGIAWDLISSDTKRFYQGTHFTYGSITGAGIEEDSWFAQLGTYHFSTLIQNATLARDVLHNYELSVSPSNQTLSLKKSVHGTWETLNSAKTAYLKTQIEPDEEGNEADDSGWHNLAKNYYNNDQYAEALPVQQKVIELKPESCVNWQNLGLVKYKMNDIDGALEAYQEASKRYHQWWDIDLDTRLSIQKSQKELEKEVVKAKKEEQKGLSPSDEPVWHHKQSSDCYINDGWVASLLLSKEKFDDVAKVYEKLDLDARLAIVQGNAAMVQGNLDLAESAYRQALRIEDEPDHRARVGLALYFADQGEWRFADPLFAEAFALAHEDGISASVWFDNARANGEDTIKKSMELKKSFPKSSTAHFIALREASIAQNTEVLSNLSLDLPPAPQNINEGIISSRIRSFVILGKTEDAQNLLEQYPEYANTPQILIAQADLAAYSGDTTKALELLKQSAQRDPSNPAVALFLR